MSMTEYLGMRWLGQREMEEAGEVEVYEEGAESQVARGEKEGALWRVPIGMRLG